MSDQLPTLQPINQCVEQKYRDLYTLIRRRDNHMRVSDRDPAFIMSPTDRGCALDSNPQVRRCAIMFSQVNDKTTEECLADMVSLLHQQNKYLEQRLIESERMGRKF